MGERQAASRPSRVTPIANPLESIVRRTMSFEILAKRVCAWVSKLRGLLNGAEDEPIEIGRYRSHVPRWGVATSATASEGLLSDEHQVQNQTERVDVGLRANALPPCRFRAHEAR